MKRVRDFDNDKDRKDSIVPLDPYLVSYRAQITWLLIAKHNKMISRHVNHDIARKIAQYVKIILSNGIHINGITYLLQRFGWMDKLFWYWRHTGHIARPCSNCLRPVGRQFAGMRIPFLCMRCDAPERCVQHEKCCGIYSNSISDGCIVSKRDTYDLPGPFIVK